MSESIRVFENSLREYLLNVQADSYNTQTKIQHKYNNLKVTMDPKKTSVPHFWVSIGISAACYQIENIDKMDGSLGSDERFVLRWASRPNINGELRKHWVYLTKSNELINHQVRNEKKTVENLEISKEEIEQAAAIMTGTGMKRRLVAFESNMRKRKHAQNPK